MDKKKFELVAFGILGLSLVYVPTKFCNGNRCISADWDLIFNLSGAQTVDFARLVIQLAVVAISLYGYWRYKYRV
jgi:hypothetical protein